LKNKINLFVIGCVVLSSDSAVFAAETVRIEDHYSSCFSVFSDDRTFIRFGNEFKSFDRTLSAVQVSEAKRAALCTPVKFEETSPAYFGITNKQIRLHEAEALDAAAQFLGPAVQLPKSLTYVDVRKAVKIALLFGASGNSTLKPNLKVVLCGSPEVIVSTDHAVPTMLPWRIQRGNEHWETYSLDVPRTFSQLLSKSSPNYSMASDREYWSQSFWRDLKVWGFTFRRKLKSR